MKKDLDMMSDEVFSAIKSGKTDLGATVKAIDPSFSGRKLGARVAGSVRALKARDLIKKNRAGQWVPMGAKRGPKKKSGEKQDSPANVEVAAEFQVTSTASTLSRDGVTNVSYTDAEGEHMVTPAENRTLKLVITAVVALLFIVGTASQLPIIGQTTALLLNSL
jgi:hypothetical protein